MELGIYINSFYDISDVTMVRIFHFKSRLISRTDRLFYRLFCTGPTHVALGIYINSFYAISEQTMVSKVDQGEFAPAGWERLRRCFHSNVVTICFWSDNWSFSQQSIKTMWVADFRCWSVWIHDSRSCELCTYPSEGRRCGNLHKTHVSSRVKRRHVISYYGQWLVFNTRQTAKTHVATIIYVPSCRWESLWQFRFGFLPRPLPSEPPPPKKKKPSHFHFIFAPSVHSVHSHYWPNIGHRGQDVSDHDNWQSPNYRSKGSRIPHCFLIKNLIWKNAQLPVMYIFYLQVFFTLVSKELLHFHFFALLIFRLE